MHFRNAILDLREKKREILDDARHSFEKLTQSPS